MELHVATLELLLLVAAVVAMLARRLRIPYSVGLVLAGVALSFLKAAPKVALSRDLVFTVLLPPLIFEAALYIPWKELRRDSAVISALATIGVIFSAVVTFSGLTYIAHWDWASALLFSILIAATDPISVIATFKEARVHGRLRFLIEAESLFNDGTAAVAFALALPLIEGGHAPGLQVLRTFLTVTVGGVLFGAMIAGLILLLAGRTEDHLVEITLSTVAAYGSFLLAERLHASGVLATLTAGLVLGNINRTGFISRRGREALESFWEYVSFVSSSLVFLLIGLNGTRENIAHIWKEALLAIALVIAGRAAAVYLTLAPFASSAWRVDPKHQHILFWGGLRGALALALALGLPNVPLHDEIITITFAVVAFSVFVQGLTVIPLMKRFGLLSTTGSVSTPSGH
jgi:CPA1 family monovalent cation:H+ antiporter